MEVAKGLVGRLTDYSKSDYYGFHMPGHKRNTFKFGELLPYRIDITEIEGFDDLHHPEEVLLESKNKAAEVFGAAESFYLINGSTVGNIAAIMSVTERGDKILIARNNHKSVYNAVYLNGLQPVYVYPKFHKNYDITGEIDPTEVELLLNKEKNIKAIVIVSPTYDGVISDVRRIAEIAHMHGIPLIVDEAHGAHLGMHKYFGENSNRLGADLVVHSVHKTLPSLTQTGLLHVNGMIVNRDKLMRYLKMLQSSSPSYILMASIERCVNIVSDEGDYLFDKYVRLLTRCREELSQMQSLKLVEVKCFDKSKIVISTKYSSLTSNELYKNLLNEYHLQMEMCGVNYVIAMTSVGDSEEGFKRLTEALLEIDSNIEKEQISIFNLKTEQIELELPQLQHARGQDVGSEWFYYIYPPGIPIVVPGEVVTDEIVELLEKYEEAGFVIRKG